MNKVEIYEDLLSLPGLKIERVERGNGRIDTYGQVDEGAQRCPNFLASTALVNQYT